MWAIKRVQDVQEPIHRSPGSYCMGFHGQRYAVQPCKQSRGTLSTGEKLEFASFKGHSLICCPRIGTAVSYLWEHFSSLVLVLTNIHLLPNGEEEKKSKRLFNFAEDVQRVGSSILS